jgi:hypothetical protein
MKEALGNLVRSRIVRIEGDDGEPVREGGVAFVFLVSGSYSGVALEL